MGTHASHALAPRRVNARTADALVRIFNNRISARLIPRSLPAVLLALFACFPGNSYAQDLTTLETSVRSGTTEQKREALFQIRDLRSEIASRAAVPALKDTEPIVRATATASVTFLPKPEALAALTPLLTDRDAFVRKESAYALGSIETPDAAGPLLDLLQREKDLEVKAAAAVALGQTGNRSAVEPLITLLKRVPNEDEEFLRRSAARSIGQIAQINKTGKARVLTPQSFLPETFKELSGDDLTTQFAVFSTAIGTLSSVLQNTRESDDTRREAAFALGAIGSRSSMSVLQASTNNADPYLAEIAREALAKIRNTATVN